MSQAGIVNDANGGVDNLVIETALGSASPIANTLIFGGNVIISAGGNVVNFNTTLFSLFPWTNISTSQTMVSNNGYLCSGGTNLSLLLPPTSSVGDEISVVLCGSSSFTITQGGSQQIQIGNRFTTAGVTGSLASTQQGDSITMVCQTQNLVWIVYNTIGNLMVN